MVLDGGGAKLVDDPAMDAPGRTSGDDVPVAAFLLDIVRAVRRSLPERRERAKKAPPWPLRVHRFLDMLSAEPTSTPTAIISDLEALVRHPPAVTRGWRAMSVGVALLLPVVWVPPIFIQFLYTTTLIEPDLRPDIMTLLLALMQVAIIAHVNALVFRGGVIRMLGLELVTADGKRASRFRVLVRTAATWVPLMIVPPASSPAHWLTYLCLLMLFAGAGVAILSPERGIQDRLAGTWIVPR